MNAQQTDIRNRINEASRQLQAAAVMWRLKGDPLFLAEALRKGDQLAALDPQGPTSFANQDQATREIAVALAKGVDVLAGDLDAARKAGVAGRDHARAPTRCTPTWPATTAASTSSRSTRTATPAWCSWC